MTKDKPIEWSVKGDPYKWVIHDYITRSKNMRITMDVPMVGINEDGENVISDYSVRFISEDCEVITLKTPDGKKFRLDHDMLQKAIETIGRVNC